MFILTRLGLLTITPISSVIDCGSYFPPLELGITVGIAELESGAALP